MRVVQLQHTRILMGSEFQTGNGVQDYTWHNEDEE